MHDEKPAVPFEHIQHSHLSIPPCPGFRALQPQCQALGAALQPAALQPAAVCGCILHPDHPLCQTGARCPQNRCAGLLGGLLGHPSRVCRTSAVPLPTSLVRNLRIQAKFADAKQTRVTLASSSSQGDLCSHPLPASAGQATQGLDPA